MSDKVNDYFLSKRTAAMLICHKTDILTSSALQTAVNPEGRNSLRVPIGLTVLTDTSYYISVMSKNSAYPASR